MAPKIAKNCTALKRVDMSKITTLATGQRSGNYFASYFLYCPNIEKIKLGRMQSFNSTNITQYDEDSPMLNLIHLELGQDTAISLDCAKWNPTNALDASRTDLIEEGSTAQNNLEQFLKNFRTYICQRLADRTGQSKLTLTLSAAVYTAIMADDDIKAELVARNWKVTDGTNNYNN